jgi:phospholipid/cholesterol/gamma-HCH transport system substrate-binding protein
MLKYRESNFLRAGLFGFVLIVLVIAVGLQPQRLVLWATSIRYHALFADAGGLVPGNKVSVSGMNVGTVSDMSLVDGGNVLVTFTVDGTVHLARETTAHIKTGSLLGQRIVTLDSAGSGTLRSTDVIPVSRTSSPYSLTEAVTDLTNNTAGTDTDQLNQSLDTLSATIDQIAPQLGPTFDGLTRLSRSLNGSDQALSRLLNSAKDVTGVLAERGQQVNSLILNTNDLFAVLVERRDAIASLLANVTVVAQQISGLVHDNEAKLAPTLDKLNSVTAMLEKNRDNLAKALPGLAKYEITQGETVASGPAYSAYVPNLQPGGLLQPFLDYAFGFRRGNDNGQPPDNAGPRAEFPWPHNAIPGGSR